MKNNFFIYIKKEMRKIILMIPLLLLLGCASRQIVILEPSAKIINTIKLDKKIEILKAKADSLQNLIKKIKGEK